MRFLINDHELDALDGMPWGARLIYLMGLRPHMDFATGLVGTERRRVSLQQLREVLHVEPGPGRTDGGAPSKDQVRRSLDVLARAGLVERQSRGRHLVLRLPLALVDVYPAETDTNLPHFRHTQPATEPATSEPASSREISEGTRQGTDTDLPQGGQAEPATPPVSGSPGEALHSAPVRAGEHPDGEVPDSPMAWVQVFMDRFGYPRDRAMQAKAMKLFRDWSERGVRVGLVADAVASAESRGTVQPVPSYFRAPVDEAMQETAQVVPLEQKASAKEGSGAGRRGDVNERWGR